MTKNSGKLVKTKTGKEGIIYNQEGFVNGKAIVHVIDNFNPTGEKLLCKLEDLTLKGFID